MGRVWVCILLWSGQIHYRHMVAQKHTQDLGLGSAKNQDLRGRVFVYYESIKRELNKRLKFDSRCDERLKDEVEGCTRLAYIMWREEP